MTATAHSTHTHLPSGWIWLTTLTHACTTLCRVTCLHRLEWHGLLRLLGLGSKPTDDAPMQQTMSKDGAQEPRHLNGGDPTRAPETTYSPTWTTYMVRPWNGSSCTHSLTKYCTMYMKTGDQCNDLVYHYIPSIHAVNEASLRRAFFL